MLHAPQIQLPKQSCRVSLLPIVCVADSQVPKLTKSEQSPSSSFFSFLSSSFFLLPHLLSSSLHSLVVSTLFFAASYHLAFIHLYRHACLLPPPSPHHRLSLYPPIGLTLHKPHLPSSRNPSALCLLPASLAETTTTLYTPPSTTLSSAHNTHQLYAFCSVTHLTIQHIRQWSYGATTTIRHHLITRCATAKIL